MQRVGLLTLVLLFTASAALAGRGYNGRGYNGISGDVASVVVQSITLADGTLLVVEPTS